MLHIFFLHQTATCSSSSFRLLRLLHIFFLHQTATIVCYWKTRSCCYISSFYIKPQQKTKVEFIVPRCYISSFYIKPQLGTPAYILNGVAIYLLSTSNRNKALYNEGFYMVAIYLLSTSNRNMKIVLEEEAKLLYIFFLHQTATPASCLSVLIKLLYIFFLHQTATIELILDINKGCYISSFYIKPQHKSIKLLGAGVAIYLLSTSNRNDNSRHEQMDIVAIYLLSTSNRNKETLLYFIKVVAIYLLSTSNRNHVFENIQHGWVAIYLLSTSNRNLSKLRIISKAVAIYLLSTSNRNHVPSRALPKTLLYIFFLHQTATQCGGHETGPSCYISSFYIKPQR